MRLFAGLGNPGQKYRHNRHNVGFGVVDEIARRHGFAPWRKRFHGLTAEGSLAGERVVLLRPETFMNDSGRSVAEAANFFKVAPGQVVEHHDLARRNLEEVRSFRNGTPGIVHEGFGPQQNNALAVQ